MKIFKRTSLLTDAHPMANYMRSNRRELASGLPKKKQFLYWDGLYIPFITDPEHKTITIWGWFDFSIRIWRMDIDFGPKTLFQTVELLFLLLILWKLYL